MDSAASHRREHPIHVEDIDGQEALMT